MKRVAFLVDGFNLYHSLKQASVDLQGATTRWLDLDALCRHYLAQIGGGAGVESIHYFSAPAKHVEKFKPGVVDRQRVYIRAIEATGVVVELGHFKAKLRSCPHCGRQIEQHEEKETDVAIAVRMLDLMWTDRCDAIALVSADSDMAPAIRQARMRFPAKQIHCLFPYARGSFDLRALASQVIRLRSDIYVRHQLPDPLVLPDGSTIRKPSRW